MSNSIIIIGAGGHGKVVADIARLNGYSYIAFLDDKPGLSECGGYSVLGGIAKSSEYPDFDFVVAIGSSAAREKIQNELLGRGHKIVSLIHPRAVVAQSAQIGEGSVVMAGAVINPDAVIGKGCIVNTCASVDHDCRIGDFSHISVGAHIAGTVNIGRGVLIGAGAAVINNLVITDGCTVGAGAAVVCDLLDKGTYVGVPAKRIK